MNKSMKALSSLNEKELQERLTTAKHELLKVNVEVASGANPSAPGKPRQLKKTIARINTLLSQRNRDNA